MSTTHDNGLCRLQLLGSTFRVAPAYTPSTHLHGPSSNEVWTMWLPTIGPTAYLAWLSLVACLPDHDTTINNNTINSTTCASDVVVDLVELAHSLGTSPGRLRSTLDRLARFRFVHTLTGDPNRLLVKRAAPPRA